MTKAQLETIARGAGFDAVGVAAAVRAPHAAAFHDWLAAGFHASLGWMAREPERRCQPELLLPGARSVIALAVNYFVPDEIGVGEADGLRGKIARYARGRDYHNFIPKRLKTIDRALAAEGGVQRCFIDSGPLLERDFAVLSGLAWQGKSTLALHSKLGTWFLLAAVVTTLKIEPDTLIAGRCGTCARCLDACPTGAIVAPYQVDARRCLSYWTIEHKGSLPKWVRPLLGDRIFGCDDCLDACPWNRFAVAAQDVGFSVRPSSRWLLRDYLALDEEAFRKLFEGSPVRRAGRQGFLRNVCTALGNVGAAGDLDALGRCVGDADPVVSEHAIWAVKAVRARMGLSESRN